MDCCTSTPASPVWNTPLIFIYFVLSLFRLKSVDALDVKNMQFHYINSCAFGKENRNTFIGKKCTCPAPPSRAAVCRHKYPWMSTYNTETHGNESIHMTNWKWTAHLVLPSEHHGLHTVHYAIYAVVLSKKKKNLVPFNMRKVHFTFSIVFHHMPSGSTNVPPLLELHKSTFLLSSGFLDKHRTLEFPAISVHADVTTLKRWCSVVGNETNTTVVSRFEHLKTWGRHCALVLEVTWVKI
jgi:hypothetical protein